MPAQRSPSSARADPGASRQHQKAKSSRTHSQIVDAVIVCLDRHGYAQTSISRVQAIAGLSRGALQHHFPSRDDLIVATAERLMARSIEVFSRPLRHTTRAVGDELLEIWIKLVNTAEYRALLEILNATRSDRRLRGRLRPILRDWNRAFDEHADALYRSTDDNPGEVRELLLMGRCLLRGLLIQQQIDNDPALSTSIIKRWIALMSPLLSARGPPP